MEISRPQRTEASEYYFTYIDQVADGDIRESIAAQLEPSMRLFDAISEEQSRFRYADGKWSVREVLSHVNDAERLFTYRAFWFARGFDSPLPSFDQDAAIRTSAAHDRSWRSHVEEFASIRSATITLFRNLSSEAWDRRGIASDNPFTVRALAYITAGHLAHHNRVLRERYLKGHPY